MKKIIRLTEQDLHNIIKASVNRILREDVLGDDWREANQEDSVMNDYEPFETQMDTQDYNWSTQGEEEFDPTFYDDPDQYKDDLIHDPTDNELYNYGNW